MSATFEQRAEEYFLARAQLAANLQILGAVSERLQAFPQGGAPAFVEPSPFAGVDLLQVADRCLAAAATARETMRAASVVFVPETLRNGRAPGPVVPVGETAAGDLPA